MHVSFYKVSILNFSPVAKNIFLAIERYTYHMTSVLMVCATVLDCRFHKIRFRPNLETQSCPLSNNQFCFSTCSSLGLLLDLCHFIGFFHP